MFSIIIPLYNKANYIEKAVTSVLGQTYQHFELIVINDGSTDDSPQIINGIHDSRLRIIHQANSGVSTARNVGVKYARFKFVAFLDADDWWHSEFLQEALIMITHCPDADLYGINYYYVKHGKNRVEEKGLPAGFTLGYVDYISIYGSNFCVPINCSFVIVRKSAFILLGGFRSVLRFGEDFDLWIRLALSGKVSYLNKPLSYSNQDVDLSNRAIGEYQLHSPASHFIFNLGYLKEYELHSTALKALLDGLRVRSLLPYYLSGQYVDEVNKVLSEVYFTRQPRYYRWIYAMPISLTRAYFAFKRIGSSYKRVLLRLVQ